MRQLQTIGNLRAMRDPRRSARVIQFPRGLGALGDGSATPAAVAMNNALAAHGYVAADLPIYAAFAKAAGLSNAYPGPLVMKALQDELFAASVAYDGPTTIYPWKDLGKGQGNYDGVNAPTWAQWSGQPAGSGPAPQPSGGGAITLPQDTITGSKDPNSWIGPVIAIGAAGLVAYLVVAAMVAAMKRRKRGRRSRGRRASLLLMA